MAQPESIRLKTDAFQPRHSRRAIIKCCGAVSLSLSGIAERSSDALALPAVSVAAPLIVRGEDCLATVSVVVTLSSIARGVRYAVYGDIMESDESDDEPDVCGSLAPQVTLADHDERLALELITQVRAADLGLVKGMGPSRDEAFSPDLVELFARIWLRDLTTDVVRGPWDSPMRIAVSTAALDWTQSRHFPGSELLVPRGGMPAAPPQACVS